jgi:glycosyltransferase involved in cell wall biosynthesis
MPKLLFFVTEDWSFCQHFLPMARAARAVGFEVVVATRIREHKQKIIAEGCRVIALESERRSLNPFEIFTAMLRMARIVRAEQPDVIHCVALRMVVLGGVAAKLASAGVLVLAPTGLGHLWIQEGPIERLARAVTRAVVAWLRGPRTHFLFENADDPKEFGLDPRGAEVTLVGGAGVDENSFAPAPEPPAPPMRVAVVARMLIPKGIRESVEAVRRARAAGAAIELHLFGTPDPSNRTSYSEADLNAWSGMEGVHWHGVTNDPACVWREHHIAMLLSYREGLPRALVEAAACGRPIVATDVVGCREVIRDGIEGILVPRGDIAATAEALARLASDKALRERMGVAARARFVARFTESEVMATVKSLYERVAVEGNR